MKKMMMMALMLLASVATFAQTEKSDNEKTGEAFFLGKWQLLVEGLPTGDADMLLVVTKNEDGKLEGTIGGLDGSSTTKLTKIVVEPKTLTVNFLGAGFDVPMYLDKEKDGTLTGSMNDMFDVTGKRYVEPKKE